MEITFVVTVTGCFRSVEDCALHPEGVMLHHTQVLRDLTAVFMLCQVAYNALLMSDMTISIIPGCAIV